MKGETRVPCSFALLDQLCPHQLGQLYYAAPAKFKAPHSRVLQTVQAGPVLPLSTRWE